MMALHKAYSDNVCARVRSLRCWHDHSQSGRRHYGIGEWWEVFNRRRGFRRSAECTALERMGYRSLAASLPTVDHGAACS